MWAFPRASQFVLFHLRTLNTPTLNIRTVMMFLWLSSKCSINLTKTWEFTIKRANSLHGVCYINQTLLHQVRPDRQRTGLGSLLLRAMANLLAVEGRDSIAIIVNGNEASTQLFLKEGFECIDEVFNIKIEPSKNTTRHWLTYLYFIICSLIKIV